MSTREIFNQARIDRCLEIERSIMYAWQKSNAFQYVARATQPIEGMPITNESAATVSHDGFVAASLQLAKPDRPDDAPADA